jgi:hypothetical protein
MANEVEGRRPAKADVSEARKIQKSKRRSPRVVYVRSLKELNDDQLFAVRSFTTKIRHRLTVFDGIEQS